MAYTAPPQWAHGDIPTAANMQKYSDGLNAIYTAINGKKHIRASRLRQWLTRSSDTHHLGVTDALSYLLNVHQWRWLLYQGAGTLSNVAGSETTSLPDTTNGGTNTFDLDSVDWLNYGMIYRVNGVNFALEDWEP